MNDFLQIFKFCKDPTTSDTYALEQHRKKKVKGVSEDESQAGTIQYSGVHNNFTLPICFAYVTSFTSHQYEFNGRGRLFHLFGEGGAFFGEGEDTFKKAPPRVALFCFRGTPFSH
jgi:hypothetical protein